MHDLHYNHHAHESFSPWMAGALIPLTPRLQHDIRTDVCIIGGGIAGLSAAYFLLRAGKKVCVLEDAQIGDGQTGRTTAQLATLLDKRYDELERLHGSAALRTIAEGQREALELVEEIVLQENIECDFRRVNGYLFSNATQETPTLAIQKEYAAIQRAGLAEVEMIAKAPLPFLTGEALRFPRQVQIHPLRYLAGLTRAILIHGGQIFTHSRAMHIDTEERIDVWAANGKRVTCDSVVVATNSPMNESYAVHLKQYAYRTYAVGAAIPKAAIPQAFYWDMENPYHYIRIIPGQSEDILLVGGEDHRTGQNQDPEKCYQRILQWMRDRFPFTENILFQWSGQVMESIDGLPYMGRNPSGSENVFVITGDSGNGMSMGTLGSKLVSDLILERRNPWAELYNPARLRMRAMPTLLREGSNTAAQYLHWFDSQQLETVASIPAGHGSVINYGLKKLAVYKNEHGKLHCVSAKCTHLGGVVSWNAAERSWDCPCHGSRFDAEGHVIEGPATKDLAIFEKDEGDSASIEMSENMSLGM